MAGCAVFAAMVTAAPAAFAAQSTEDLKKLSVEQLMDVEIYSASRRLEPTQAVPSAIFVLTHEDIRRSRVTSIPDALRLVPGVQVGQVDANKYAVSIRGFNSREANKLLVLVDGRSVYDPLFSGMLWESQDLMLENVERIEVIRGPGGTLWGANAVNGVINIITKNARDTQGGLATATVGDQEKYSGALRYGWQPGENQHARVYVKAFERDEGYSRIAPPYDASRAARGGFRWDWSGAGGDEVRVSGDTFKAETGVRELPVPSPPVTEVQDVEHRGTNLLVSWIHPLSDASQLRLQAYVDRITYDSVTFDQTRNVHDFELQHTFRAGSRHELLWGLGYRRMRDDTSVDFFGLISVTPARRDDELSTVFVQDTIALVPDRLALTLGTKYESTDYARSEWQPSVRLAWTPSEEQTWWAAASRAVRVPSRLEADLTYFGVLRPGDTFESEQVNAYEAGMRRLITPTVWLDVATFYNRYDDLGTNEAGGFLRNMMAGHTYGGEVAARWNPVPRLRVDAIYSHLRMNLALDAGSTGNPALPLTHEGLAPRHQVVLRSTLDLPHHLEVDAAARYVDELPALAYSSYVTLDFGLGWRPPGGFEVALVGRNLVDSPHPEQDFVFSSSGVPSQVERSVYLRLGMSF
jgi:iron complex outermembrane receptor protein